jgi:hypothetical protein
MDEFTEMYKRNLKPTATCEGKESIFDEVHETCKIYTA